MRTRIFGAIGLLWGGAIVARGLLLGASEEAGAYQTGQIVGYIVGAILLVVGGYYLFRQQKG